jgi:uncharacterized membrane protein
MRVGERITAPGGAVHGADRPPSRVIEAAADRYAPAARAESIAVAWWLPLVAAAALMLWGFFRLQATAPYAAQQLYQAASTGRLAWSDIISIYGRDYMAGHPFPYTSTGLFEYPVLTGLVFYVAGYAGYVGDATPAFLVNYLILAASGLGLLWLIVRYPGATPWLFALSPALVLYTGANWDLLALFPGIAALILYQQRRDLAATVLLALSIWLKFFPLLWLPLVLFERARRGEWRTCGLIVAIFSALSLLINVPFALRDQHEWARFFTFNRERDPEVNFWTIIRDYHLSTDTINTLSLLAVLCAIAVLWRLQWARADDITIPAAAALMVWFLFINKVYSPQYFLWILPFLALLAAPLWLAVGLAFVDVIYYTASFQILHFGCPGCDGAVQTFSNWDFDHVLEPAMELREAAFLLLIGWIVVRHLMPKANRAQAVEAAR